MRRRGFTLIEMLVVLVVILTLAAIVIPQVAGRAREATPTAVISSLSTLADAIGQFKADVRRYPQRLDWLATTAGSPTDICGAAIPPGLLDRWSGPYVQRQIGGAGIPAGDATILNLLERADPAATEVSSLILKAADVTQDAAESIDREIDGTVDLNAGAIRWTGAGAADTLYYHIAIRGC